MKKLPDDLKLIFDFDSTFIKLETLEVIAQIYLKGNPDSKQIQSEIQRITDMGMDGQISFKQSLESRMKLLKMNKDNINEAIEIINQNISDSFVKNKQFFMENSNNIYILSGGFTPIIAPVVLNYGISNENILANELILDNENVVGIESTLGLLEPKGKPTAIKNKNIHGKIIMIGDGYTDLEVKLAGAAEKFIAYCENIKRDSILKQADLIAYSLDDIFNFLQL
jgi:D-3-phosphoglycerate dehydrogenase